VFLALVASAGLLAATAGAGGGAASARRLPAGVLYTLASPPTKAANESGLFLLTPGGRVTPLLSRQWRPWAQSRTGVVAASRARFREGALWLVKRHRAVRIPGSSGASCVSWSADGSRLTYVTGRWVIYAHLPRDQVAWGRVGSVWAVRASAPRHPLRVATGLSAAGGCPAWSASRTTLAYLIRSEPQSGPWTLDVVGGGPSISVATLASAVPAMDYDPFDWAPDKPELVFVDGTSVYSYDGTTTKLLGPPGSLDPVQSLSTSRGFDVSNVHVRFSPSGHFIAAGITGATGIVRRDGTLLQNFVGGFDGWAGNTGVLTLASERSGGGPIVLRLRPLDGDPSRVLSRYFKRQVATDVSGRWFAYFDRPSSTLVFRRPSGTVIKSRHFRRHPVPVASVSADGRTTSPVGAYSSPWSR
jgi:hypothetical protein